uniref:Attachment glycoprotein n=1 Tax=Niviventer confucianus jeilongvirus TaxID=3049975 RepID=A0A9Y1Z4G0_9MONO|nr:attachment glycoprotein [Niviventer confucianus jeilongvirus]
MPSSPSLRSNRDSYITKLGEYYGTANGIPEGSNGKQQGSVKGWVTTSDKASSVLNACSWLLGMTVSVVLIIFLILGILALRTMRNELDAQRLKIDQSTEVTVQLGSLLRDLINPRIDLINNMVSYTIPSLMNQIKHDLAVEIQKKNNVVFEYKNNTCPKVPYPVHSPHFREFDQDSLTRCQNRGFTVQLNGEITIKEMPSFIPSQTTITGCTRIPSLAVSPFIWAYTHNVIRHGCNDSSTSNQYFAIGVIGETSGDAPHFETLSSWYLDDDVNRKSCAVAAGVTGAWMVCTIVTSTFRDDYCSPEISPIVLSFMDVFGRKRYWIYENSMLKFANLFVSLHIGVGSGVIVDGVVYIPFYAGLKTNDTLNSFCHAPGCSNPEANTCNQATKITYLCSRTMINGILVFNDSPMTRPKLDVVVINARSNWLGAEMRLFHNYRLGITYVYSRSSGWHALPQLGLINLRNLAQIIWVDVVAIGRPGSENCDATSRCPNECLSGVYNDIFPLGRYFEFGATVYLDSDRSRINPVIALMNTTNVFARKTLTTPTQQAQYSTTTCFMFKEKPWCVSVVEISPTALGSVVPIPFTYTIPLVCATTLSRIGGDVGDDRSRIRLTVPSIDFAGGVTVSLDELRSRWLELKLRLPPVLYPFNYSTVTVDIFDTDQLLNPYAVPVRTGSTVLGDGQSVAVRPVSDVPSEGDPLTVGQVSGALVQDTVVIGAASYDDQFESYYRSTQIASGVNVSEYIGEMQQDRSIASKLLTHRSEDVEAMTKIRQLVLSMQSDLTDPTKRDAAGAKLKNGIRMILFNRSLEILKGYVTKKYPFPQPERTGQPQALPQVADVASTVDVANQASDILDVIVSEGVENPNLDSQLHELTRIVSGNQPMTLDANSDTLVTVENIHGSVDTQIPAPPVAGPTPTMDTAITPTVEIDEQESIQNLPPANGKPATNNADSDDDRDGGLI